MSKFLSKDGLTHLVGALADGSLVVGEAINAASADVASSVAASNITGVLSLSQLPKGAIEELKIVADDEARFALKSTDVQAGDTVKVQSSGKMYFVVDGSKLNSEEGYEEYSAGTATLAKEASKVTNGLKIKLGGTEAATFDGSEAEEVDITPDSIGAATAAQGLLADNSVQKESGKGLSTNDYTTAEKNKLAGIEAGAQAHIAPTKAEVTTALGYTPLQADDITNKVDKVSGKGLSANDYTDTEKNKLAGIEAGAQAHIAPTKGEVTTALGYTPLQSSDITGKVDKVSGKGLSTNDYTTAEKNKLGGIEAGAQVHIAPTKTEVTTALGYTPLQASDIAGKVDKVTGKGLSTNDYTTTEKNKLAGIAAGATADSALSNDEIDEIISTIMNA